MRVSSIVLIYMLTFFLQMPACHSSFENPIVTLKGPNDEAELVFFYKKDTGSEEKQFFENNILHKPRLDGKGNDSWEGVSGEFFVRNSDYEGHVIEFFPTATIKQREKLKKAIEESPIVYKVFENVVPNEIKDL